MVCVHKRPEITVVRRIKVLLVQGTMEKAKTLKYSSEKGTRWTLEFCDCDLN